MKRKKFSPYASLEERIAYYSRPAPNGCLIWTGSTNAKGYAHLSFKGRMRRLARLIMELERGVPLPLSLHVLHKCDNPRCISRDHLFLGTNKDNSDDKVAKGRQTRGPAHVAAGRLAARSRSKLTVEQVRAMRADPRPLGLISAQYGISKAQACRIRSGRQWVLED